MPIVYNAPPQDRSGDEWLSFGTNVAALGLQAQAQKAQATQDKIKNKWAAIGEKARARGEDPWLTLSRDETSFRELYKDIGFSDEAVESQWKALSTDPSTFKAQATTELNKIMGGAPAQGPNIQDMGAPPPAQAPASAPMGPMTLGPDGTSVQGTAPAPAPVVTPPTAQGPVPRVAGAPVLYPGGEPLSYNVAPPSVSGPATPPPYVGNRGMGYGMQTQAPGGVQSETPSNAPGNRGAAYQAAANAQKAASMDEGVPAASASSAPKENPIMGPGDFEGGVLPSIPKEFWKVQANLAQGGPGESGTREYAASFEGPGGEGARERLRAGIGLSPEAGASKAFEVTAPRIAQEGVTLSKAMDAAALAGETGDMKAYRGAAADAIRASKRFSQYAGRVISTAEYEDISKTPEGRAYLAESFRAKLTDPAWRASYALVHPESAGVMDAIGRENDPAFKALAEGRSAVENAKTQAELAKAQAEILKAQLGLEGSKLDLEGRKLDAEIKKISLDIAKTNLEEARAKGKTGDKLSFAKTKLDTAEAFMRTAVTSAKGDSEAYLKDPLYKNGWDLYKSTMAEMGAPVPDDPPPVYKPGFFEGVWNGLKGVFVGTTTDPATGKAVAPTPAIPAVTGPAPGTSDAALRVRSKYNLQ